MNPHSHSVPVKHTIHYTLLLCVRADTHICNFLHTVHHVPQICILYAYMNVIKCVLIQMQHTMCVCHMCGYAWVHLYALYLCVCVCVCGRMGGILTYQCCSVTSSLYESGLLKTNWIYGQFGRYLRHGVCVCVCVCARVCVRERGSPQKTSFPEHRH